MHAPAQSTKTELLFWLTLLVGNLLIWTPIFFNAFPTIGLGHDSQIFTAAVHSALRNGNLPWEPMIKILSAREDIFSYPYFGVLYPFYFTLGFTDQFDYHQNLILDFCSVVFHMVLASVTFGLLLKLMGCNKLIAAIYGLLYAYCLHLKLWSSWLWALSGYTWVPLCVAGVWEVLVNKNYLRGTIFISIGFGFASLGTGLPLIYGFLLAASMFLGCMLYTRATPKSEPKAFLSLLFGGLVAFCVGASNLIPSLYRSSEYIRWYSGGSITGGFKPPYEGTLAAVLEFSPKVILQLFAPVGWSGLGHVYLGCGVVVFALYYIAHNYQKPFVWPLIALAAYFVLDAFGDATIVHRLTYHLPLLGSIRYPLANVFIALFVVLLFSALGASQLTTRLKQKNSRREHRWLIFLALSCLASAIPIYIFNDSLINGFNGANNWLLYLPSVASMVYLVLLPTPAVKLIRYAPVMIMSTYVVQSSMLFHPKIPQNNALYLSCPAFSELYESLQQASANQNTQGRLAVQVSPGFPKSLDNCLSRFKLNGSLLGSVALMAGWDVNQIYHSPRPVREFKLMSRFNRRLPEVNTAYQAGVTHLLVDKLIPASDATYNFWTLVESVSGLYFYKIKDPAKGLSTLGCVTLQESSGRYIFPETSLSRSITLDSNHRNTDQIKCSQDQTGQISESNYELSSISRGSSKVVYQAHLGQPGLLVTDQVYNTDWIGDYDGNEIGFIQVDGYRLAAILPEGDYKITLKYKPLDFTIGIYLTYLGLFLLTILILLSLKKTKAEHSCF